MDAFQILALSDFFQGLLLVLLIPLFLVLLPVVVGALEKTGMGQIFTTAVGAILLLIFCFLPLAMLIIRGF